MIASTLLCPRLLIWSNCYDLWFSLSYTFSLKLVYLVVLFSELRNGCKVVDTWRPRHLWKGTLSLREWKMHEWIYQQQKAEKCVSGNIGRYGMASKVKFVIMSCDPHCTLINSTNPPRRNEVGLLEMHCGRLWWFSEARRRSILFRGK